LNWNTVLYNQLQNRYNFQFKSGLYDGQSGTPILKIDFVIDIELDNEKLYEVST